VKFCKNDQDVTCMHFLLQLQIVHILSGQSDCYCVHRTFRLRTRCPLTCAKRFLSKKSKQKTHTISSSCVKTPWIQTNIRLALTSVATFTFRFRFFVQSGLLQSSWLHTRTFCIRDTMRYPGSVFRPEQNAMKIIRHQRHEVVHDSSFLRELSSMWP
jgi:hypothetical protein